MNQRQRILAAGLFVVSWGTNVSTPLILRYQDRLGLSDLGAVGIFTVYVIGILGSLLFAGRISDRYGRRPLILPFTAASGVASVILIFGQDSLALLLIGRLLLGAVSGAVLSVGTAWLTELTDGHATSDSDRMKLASNTTVMVYIGFGFGPITSALYDWFGPYPLVVPYVVHALCTAVVLGFMWGLPETKPGDASVSLRPKLGVPPAARSVFVRTLAPSALWVFGFPSTSFALFPVILRDAVGADLDVMVAGVTGTVTAMSVLFSRPILRRVADPASAIRAAMWIGCAGYGLGTTAFITDLWPLVPLAAVLLGTASGTILSGGLALTESVANASNRGALNATFYLGAYCGMTMPVIITFSSRLFTLNGSLLIVTVTAVTAATLISVSAGKEAAR